MEMVMEESRASDAQPQMCQSLWTGDPVGRDGRDRRCLGEMG